MTRPTAAELEILGVLWRCGPSTVRQVAESLARQQGYTTILKLMQIMHGKGLVERDESGQAHIYRAAQAKEQVQSSLVGDLIDRAFAGSAHSLVVSALSRTRATPEEIAELRRLLDAHDEGRQ